jgi:hypothetical protein
MLGLEDSDFSNKDLMFHLNYMRRVCGNFETTDSTARAMSILECEHVTEKESLPLLTWSQKQVQFPKCCVF